MSKKRESFQVIQLNRALELNGRAQLEGPKRKRWTLHDLKATSPLKPAQEELFYEYAQGQNICAHGTAGTGKTFVATYLALTSLLSQHPDDKIERIIIVRSAVPTRDVGFVPGTYEEKIALYEAPYHNIFQELLGRPSSYQDMKDAGLVEFCTTSFIRGITWDHAVVLVDEGQSMTFHEINSVMTRIGIDSRVIFTGDLPQTDLRTKYEQTGMHELLLAVSKMSSFSSVKFTRNDIVRGPFVKQWITTCEDLGIAA